MFYACGGGRACLNPFNSADTDEAVNQDVDTDNDHEEDVVDDSNDEKDNVQIAKCKVTWGYFDTGDTLTQVAVLLITY